MESDSAASRVEKVLLFSKVECDSAASRDEKVLLSSKVESDSAGSTEESGPGEPKATESKLIE